MMWMRRRVAALLVLAAFAGPTPASLSGCKSKCEKLCERGKKCLSKSQIRRYNWSMSRCVKECKKIKLDEHAAHCLDVEGGCFRYLDCYAKAFHKAAAKAGYRKKRR